VLKQNQVIPVDEFRFAYIAEKAFDFVASPAENAPGFRSIVIDQPAGDFPSVRIEAAYDFAPFEVAAHIGHADRQKAFAANGERFHRSFIQCDISPDLQMVRQPLLASAEQGGETGQVRGEVIP
jgi:hypothetical protein